jgi:PAS domain S-box-containing protein
MKGTPVKTFELEMKTKDDKRLCMEVNATIAKYKHRLAAVLILRDVTERKQIERRLRESEKKYRTIVETSIQGIAIAQDGRVVLTNPALSSISGYTIEELLSLSPEQAMAVIHSDDRVRIESVFQDRLAGKIVPATYELRMIRKDGTVHWLQIYSTLMKYNGRPAIQISCIDITNQKKAEEEIRTLARYPYENPNPILRVNRDGVILHANPASEVLLVFCHLGDIGQMLSPSQIIEVGSVDVLFIPVGGFYTIGPEQARKVMESLKSRITVPMHYRLPGMSAKLIFRKRQ